MKHEFIRAVFICTALKFPQVTYGAASLTQQGNGNIGADFALLCTITPSFTSTATWAKDGNVQATCTSSFCTPNTTSVFFTYSSNGISVTFKPLSLSHGGVWECAHLTGTASYTLSPVSANNVQGTATIPLDIIHILWIILVVIVGYLSWRLWKKFYKSVKDHRVDLGEKIELLSSFPSTYLSELISVKWMVNGEPVIDKDNAHYQGGNLASPPLVICRAALHDAGMYECILKLNDEKEEKVYHAHLDVIVYEGDKVGLLENIQRLLENIQVTDAIKTVEWMHEKRSIIVDDPFFYTGGTCDHPSLTITCVTTYDAGNYVCKMTFNHSSLRTFPVKLIVREKLYTADAGDKIELLKNIQIQNDVEYVKWFCKGKEITTGGSSFYQGGNKQCPPLTVWLVDSNDAGNYQCTVLFKNKEKNIRVQLRVNEKLYTADAGDKIELLKNIQMQEYVECVKWSCKGKEITTGDSSFYQGGNKMCPPLTICLVDSNDAGNYQCIVMSNNKEKNIRVQLRVNEKIYTADAGDQVELLKNIQIQDDCEYVKWFCKGKEITTGDSPFYQGGNKQCPPLTVCLVDLNDAGNYQCTVLSKNKEKNIRVQLRLNEKIYTADAGDQIELLKNIQIQDDCEYVKWFCKGKEITTGDSSFYHGGNKQCPPLTVCLVDSNDAGNYQCTVLSKNKEKNIRVQLRLNEKIYTADAGDQIELLKNIQIQDDCEYVKWFCNGKEITTGDSSFYQGGNKQCPPLTICLVDSNDVGNYQCTVMVKNKEKNIRVQLRVNVQTYMAKIGGRIMLLPQLSRKTFTKVTWKYASGETVWSNVISPSNETDNSTDALKNRFSGGNEECPALTINQVTEADSKEYHCILLLPDQSLRTIKVKLCVEGKRPLQQIGIRSNRVTPEK